MTNVPQRLWTTHVDQAIIQPLQVVGDTLFLATKLPEQRGKHSALQAINLTDGTLNWQHTFEYALINGLQPYQLLTEKEDALIVATGSRNLLRGQGSLYAFDSAGSIVWQWQGKAQHYSAPAIKEQQLLVTAGANTLLVINPEVPQKNGVGDTASEDNGLEDNGLEDNGLEDNALQIPLPIAASLAAPAVHGPTIYIPCRTPDLLAVSFSGDIQWQFQTQGHKADWLDQTPTIVGNTLFTVSRQGTIFALNAISGQHLWQQAISDNRPLSCPVAAGNRLYVGSQLGMHVLDSNSGQTVWTFPTTRAIVATPLIVGDTVYVACEDHCLYALDAHSGQEQWRLEMARRLETAPILTPTCLLIADRGGTIVALEPPVQPETLSVQDETSSHDQKRVWAEAYETQGDFMQSAQLWREIGALEKAATAYERGNLWREAAELWLQIDRYGKRAQALEKYAAFLEQPACNAEEIAAAWEIAARAHAEIGQREARRRCEREVARHRQLPILTIEIEPEDLVVGRWSKINYTVRNEGFGSARNLDVVVIGEHFETHPVATQTMVTLRPSKTHQTSFDVAPQVSGPHVPLQLSIDYLDKAFNRHHLKRTFQVAITSESEAISQSTSTTDSAMFARLASPDGRNLAHLRQQLITSFNSEELNEIIFDLGLHEDDFKAELSPKARKLIIWALQHNRVDKLIAECQKRRPHVEW